MCMGMSVGGYTHEKVHTRSYVKLNRTVADWGRRLCIEVALLRILPVRNAASYKSPPPRSRELF